MKKIMLDGQEVKTLDPESLPTLIHGNEGSGASLYTICLAAKWYSQGYKLIVLCGYSMAEEQFANEVGKSYPNVRFFTKEKVTEYTTLLNSREDKTIIIVKNIELFDDSVIESIKGIDNLIISGDLTKSPFKEKILAKKFVTEVYFSDLIGREIPPLEKYFGFVLSGTFQGLTKIIS